MVKFILSIILFTIQEEVPFRSSDSFEIKFDMSFKQRPEDNLNTVHLNETKVEAKNINNGPLPYLILKVKLLKLFPDETKIKVYKDNNVPLLTKKVVDGMEFKLDLGFTSDIKDGISGYKHVIEFMSPDKRAINRIVIEFDRDGNYIVNKEKRGKI